MNGRASGAAILLTLLGGGAAVVGCNFIVGVGDYSIEGDGGGGAEDGTLPEDGGPPPDAGAPDGDGGTVTADARGDRADGARLDAGPGGDAADAARDVDAADVVKAPRDTGVAPDEGPDAPAAMDGNVRPDTGAEGGGMSDGGVDAGLTCGQGIPTTQAFANLVKTCVYATSCDPYVLPVSLSDCIGNKALSAGPANGPFSCLSTISDCAGYYACEGIRLATLDPSECQGIDSKCVGNVAYDCSGAVPFPGTVTNCSLIPGATCLVRTDDVGNSRADCVVVPTCTVPPSGTPQCSGNNVYTCESLDGGTTGVGLGRSCGTGQCVTGGSAGAHCTFVGSGVCSSPNGGNCVGTTLQESCATPNTTFNFDCTASGGTCATDTANNIACVSPGCPVVSTCAESCTGNTTLTTCVGGAPFPIDCTAYGAFNTCSPTDSQNTLTFCTPN